MNVSVSTEDCEELLDPNLQSKPRTSTVISLESCEYLGFEHNKIMSPRSANQLSALTSNSGDSQAPCLVDGAFSSKPDLTWSPGSIRPHQVDAVHPFFNGYRNVKLDKSSSTDNQVFYCRQCEISIELCQEAVNQHFITKQHRPIEEKCVYCHTAVYEYYYNENVYYYHRCPSEQQQKQIFSGSSNGISESGGSRHQESDDDEKTRSSNTTTVKSSCCGPL